MVEQCRVFGAEPAVFHLDDHDSVVGDRETFDDAPDHPGGYVLQQRKIERTGRPMVAREAFVMRSGEAIGERTVAGAEQVDEHVSRALDGRPGGRDARHVEGREWRNRGEGGERGHREADGRAVGGAAGHHRDSRSVPTEGQLERREVVDDVRFHTTSKPCPRRWNSFGRRGRP